MEEQEGSLPPQARQPADQSSMRERTRMAIRRKPDGFDELLAQCPEESYDGVLAWMAKRLKQNRQIVESWYPPQDFAGRRWPEAFIERLFADIQPAQLAFTRLKVHFGDRIRRLVPVESGLRIETEDLNVLLRPTPAGVSLVVAKRGATSPSKSEITFVDPDGAIPTVLG